MRLEPAMIINVRRFSCDRGEYYQSRTGAMGIWFNGYGKTERDAIEDLLTKAEAMTPALMQ